MKYSTPCLLVCCIALLTLLSACPISTSYPLLLPSDKKIDKSWLGIWKNDSASSEVSVLSISMARDNMYGIKIVSKGEMYMADTDTFNAWIGHLGKFDYLVLREVNDTVETETYYVYEFKKQKDRIITHDISLKVGGVEAIQSVETYQSEVMSSSKMDGFLSSELHWHR